MAAMKCAVLFLVAVLAVAMAGCKSGNDIAGKWKGSVEFTGEAAKNPMAEMAKSMMGNISLELKPDKKFAMTMGMSVTGSWTQDGSTVTLTPDSTGKSEKPLVLTVSADGEKMTTTEKEATLVFTRDK